MIKFLAKLVGWLMLAAIGFSVAIGLASFTIGLVGMFVVYVVPAAIAIFAVGSLLYVVWGLIAKD